MARTQPHEGVSATKRALREQRVKRQRQARLLVIIGVVVVVVAVAAVITIPQILEAQKPVGTIVQITPDPRPQANGVSAGDPNAKIHIDVYEDFQCPSCKNYSESVEPLLMKNEVASGKVYYTYHHFPIIDRATSWNDVNKESHQAANASMCAADQNRFWDYHDLLFVNWTGENVGDFTDKRLVAFAQALNLDMTKFNACFSANTFRAKIDADIASGTQLSVSGTPSVFVNNKEVRPGFIPTYEDMQAAIAAAQ